MITNLSIQVMPYGGQVFNSYKLPALKSNLDLTMQVVPHGGQIYNLFK